MKEFQSSLPDPNILDSTITLLENTAVYVDIFSNSNSKIGIDVRYKNS